MCSRAVWCVKMLAVFGKHGYLFSPFMKVNMLCLLNGIAILGHDCKQLSHYEGQLINFRKYSDGCMQLGCGNEDNRTNLAVYSILPDRRLGGRLLMRCVRILIWGTQHI
jgi:hypothetical protein